MKKIEKFKTLEEGILLLQKETKYKSVSVGKILQLLPGKGRSLALIFLSFPFCLPIQIPGLSIPFGLAIAFIGARMAFGQRVWLPKRILSKTLKTKTIQKITVKALSLIKNLKRWLHPRLTWISHFSYMHIVNGLIIFFLGLFLALPFPIPLSNLMAAWSIFLIGLGLLEDDGVFVLFGYLMFLLTIIFFIAIALSIEQIF